MRSDGLGFGCGGDSFGGGLSWLASSFFGDRAVDLRSVRIVFPRGRYGRTRN